MGAIFGLKQTLVFSDQHCSNARRIIIGVFSVSNAGIGHLLDDAIWDELNWITHWRGYLDDFVLCLARGAHVIHITIDFVARVILGKDLNTALLTLERLQHEMAFQCVDNYYQMRHKIKASNTTMIHPSNLRRAKPYLR